VGTRHLVNTRFGAFLFKGLRKFVGVQSKATAEFDLRIVKVALHTHTVNKGYCGKGFSDELSESVLPERTCSSNSSPMYSLVVYGLFERRNVSPTKQIFQERTFILYLHVT
jgi:hypothetical protein